MIHLSSRARTSYSTRRGRPPNARAVRAVAVTYASTLREIARACSARARTDADLSPPPVVDASDTRRTRRIGQSASITNSGRLTDVPPTAKAALYPMRRQQPQ